MYYGARYYDPKISLFFSVDPLAEQFQGWSPYNYTMNNPLNLVDPTGMAPEDPTDPPTKEKSNGDKVTSFFKGFGNGFKSGWNDTKKFVKSLSSEEGWLDVARSTELMFSPSLNSNGDSYVKNERQQIANSLNHTFSNLDKLSSYDWGYGFGYVSEKLVETVAIRKFGNASKMIDPFSMRGGYGAFGENGLKFGNYRMDLMYANPSAGQGAGTIFSLKQMKSGGSLWRMDYGKLHTTGKMGFHSTDRFHWNGTKYGSTAQRTWYPSTLKAPFFRTLK